MKKSLLAAAASLLLAPLASHAVTVNGITWNEASGFDLAISSANILETTVDSVGDPLSGFGIVNSINTSSNFACAGCELTFYFDGFTVSQIENVTGGVDILFTGGQVTFYVDASADFDAGSVATAQDGAVWLQLTAQSSYWSEFDDNAGGTGTLFSQVVGTAGNPLQGSSGFGNFNATGGPAQIYVNTNTRPVFFNGADLIPDFFADFSFSSSFQFNNGNPDYPIFGSGELLGETRIPEPATLTLLGAALLGFGAVRRRIAKR